MDASKPSDVVAASAATKKRTTTAADASQSMKTRMSLNDYHAAHDKRDIEATFVASKAEPAKAAVEDMVAAPAKAMAPIVDTDCEVDYDESDCEQMQEAASDEEKPDVPMDESFASSNAGSVAATRTVAESTAQGSKLAELEPKEEPIITDSSDEKEDLAAWNRRMYRRMRNPWYPSKGFMERAYSMHAGTNALRAYDTKSIVAAAKAQQPNNMELHHHHFWVEKFHVLRYVSGKDNCEGKLSALQQAWNAFAINVRKDVAHWLETFESKKKTYMERSPSGAAMEVHFASIDAGQLCAVPQAVYCPLCWGNGQDERLKETYNAGIEIDYDFAECLTHRMQTALERLRFALNAAKSPKARSKAPRSDVFRSQARGADARSRMPEPHRAYPQSMSHDPPMYRAKADNQASARDSAGLRCDAESLVDHDDQPESQQATAVDQPRPIAAAVVVGTPVVAPTTGVTREKLLELENALLKERIARAELEQEVSKLRPLVEKQHEGLKSQQDVVSGLMAAVKHLRGSLEETREELRDLKRARIGDDTDVTSRHRT